LSHQPIEKFRRDYVPTPFTVSEVHLDFQIQDEGKSLVTSKLLMQAAHPSPSPIVLNGRKDVELVSVKINGTTLSSTHYSVNEKGDLLTVQAPASSSFELEIVTSINPAENSLLEGLYKSGGSFSTQCEAEGFRGITFFYDRPDVMAKYTTRIEAPKASCPVLLSNGNLKESGEAANGRHYAVWVDPFPKPCYLFALVAGDLEMKERSFKTSSGRNVALRIFVSKANIGKVDFALESLIKSMKWDEDVFGLEYDLDLFNIVAVDDFNMGAMENKSLNIFNSRLVLASPETATDGDYARIEGVVGHEYFHNWTGNRVTCRDWFQLTLKEGLTVYRDQEFSADMNSRSVKRIEDVSTLRVAQFSQDEGPMAHPIRPDSYIKMDNFYTVTVYEKGAEVIRLYATLLGKEGFRKGMDLYFKRHDGSAVTCDDFRAAMADANGVNLDSLGTWYSQAGTPRVHVTTTYDAGAKTFTIKAKQHTPSTPGQANKQPVLIPLSVGLLAPNGR
jgi:aminopeptidase N